MTREIRDIDSLKGLIEYFQRNLKKGYKLDELKWALIDQGHSRVSVDKAVKYVTDMIEAQKLKKMEMPKPEVLQMPMQVEEKKSFWQKIKSWFG